MNRKRYQKKDNRAQSDISRRESELHEDPKAEEKISVRSNQDLGNAAHNFNRSPARPSDVILRSSKSQQLGLETLSVRMPQDVPETPGTVLQKNIENSPSSQFQKQIEAFQQSMLDAFNKLSEQQNHLQAQLLAPSAIISKPPLDLTLMPGDQSVLPDPRPGPSSVPQASPPMLKNQPVSSQKPMETKVMPEFPPRLQGAQYWDVSVDSAPEKSKSEKFKKQSDRQNHKPKRYVSSSSKESQPYHSWTKTNRSSTMADDEKEKGGLQDSCPTILYGDVGELDKERAKEMKEQLSPDLIISRKVDLSDLPSQYIEDIETFRQVLNIPDPRENIPVSSCLVMGLNPEAQKQEAKSKGPSPFLPPNPVLKEELNKWEQEFKNTNLPEGKFIKPPKATGMWYKMGDSCFEEKLQELNKEFANICISPMPKAAPWGSAPLHILKEFEHQARQNICTINFSVAFNKVTSECNLVMERCRDSIKSVIKKGKQQIQKGADPERTIRNTYDKARDYLDVLDNRIQIQQRALACQSKAMGHMLQRDLYIMGNTGLIRRDAEMTNLHPELGKSRRQELRNSPFLASSLFHSQLVKEGKEFLVKKDVTNFETPVFRPYPNQTFRGPKKGRGNNRRHPYGGQSTPSNTRSTLSRGSSYSRSSRGQFRLDSRGRGCETP